LFLNNLIELTFIFLIHLERNKVFASYLTASINTVSKLKKLTLLCYLQYSQK